MERTPLFFLLAIAAFVLVWQTAMRAREAALRAARDACRKMSVQLLDDTVACVRLRPVRAANGRGWCLRRTFVFEFSSNGNNRGDGSLLLEGGEATLIDLRLPQMEIDPKSASPSGHFF